MSKTLAKFNFPVEFKSLQNKVNILNKNTRTLSKILEVKSTSGKNSREIDEGIVIAYGEINPSELNGVVISDPKNNLFLIRQNGLWRKILTEIL